MQRVVLLKQEMKAKGGLEKATMRIANAFVTKGCEVTIVTGTEAADCPTALGISIASFPIQKWLPHQQLNAWDAVCQSYISRQPSDVVLGFDRTTRQTHIRAGNGIHAAYLKRRGAYASRLKQVSFSWNPLHRSILRLEKEALDYPRLKKLIVNSAMVRDEAIEHYQVDAKRIEVIHNGVEWSELEQTFQNWPALRDEAAKEIGSDPRAFHFLFAGHEYGRKGLDALLLGMSQLKTDAARLLVIGRDKEISSYKAMAERLGLKHVYFLGPRNDLWRFYALADAAVIPSFYDPFANVTLEALALGLFVVTSRFNGGHEVLTGESGIIIDELSHPDSVAKSLRQALRHPKTVASARAIRDSVRSLDYPLQLERFTSACLS